MAHKKWVIKITNPDITQDVVYFGEKFGVARYLLKPLEARKFYSKALAQAFINRKLTATKPGVVIEPVLYERGGNGDVQEALERRQAEVRLPSINPA